jgi:hypothetical protein
MNKNGKSRISAFLVLFIIKVPEDLWVKQSGSIQVAKALLASNLEFDEI